MSEAIILFFTLIFIVCGMYFVCRSIYNIYYSSKSGGRFYVLLVGDKDDTLLAQKVYSAFVQMNLMNFSKHNEVVVLDLGVSENVKRECYNIIDGKGRVIFVEEDSLCYFLIERENKL